MAQTTEQSLLNKLLQTRYPLTYYLSRQQQFVNAYSTPPTVAAPTPLPPTESATTIGQKRKTPLLPPPPCFNVPDTLDFNATEYGHNDIVNQSLEMEEDDAQDNDDTLLLKNINNRLHNSNGDMINERISSVLQRSSSIQLEFSPYENNSPLEKAIQNGLNIINK